MKKRLIAILLAVCTMAAMLSGLCVTASASNDISGDKLTGYVIGYTLAKDDTVSKVCKKLGIDFQANQAAITRINNIADYTKLAVGRVIWLPATEVGKAENYYTLKTHTLVAGDSLDTLCSRYGITTGDVLLNRMNTNLTNLSVGQVLTFPAYTGSGNGLGTTGTTVAGGAPISTGTGTGAVIGTGTGTGSVISAPTYGGDTIAYYLIPYIMQSGDTVAQVCANLGISFNANQGLITRVNNITNYTRVAAGRTILLPSNTPSGGTCYAVYAHTLIQGDYVLKLCNDFGISYNANQALLKALNNTNLLDKVQAGKLFYLPVSGAFGAGGAGGIGGSGTVVGGGTGTGNTQLYAITSAATTNGAFSVKVGGAVASSAMEGETVTVSVNGNTGYVETEINVFKTGSSSTTVAVSNNTFVMPAYPVTVKVTFSKAELKNITYSAVSPADSATFTLKENGALITGGKAYSGSEMTVAVTPKNGYSLDEIVVEKADDSTVRISVSDNKFIMPNFDIKITVYMTKGKDFGYKLSGVVKDGNGTIDLKVNGSISDRAKIGQKVTVVSHPNKGYKVDYINIEYVDKNGYSQVTNVTNNSFTMPEVFDENSVVEVWVRFVTETSYSITCEKSKINGQSIGLVAKNINDKNITSSAPGETVMIVSNSKEYEIQTITVFNKKTQTYLCQNQGNPTFKMPEGSVTVTAVLQKISTPKKINVIASGGYGNSKLRIISEGISTDVAMPSGLGGTAYPGSTVTIVSTPEEGHNVIGAKISYKYGNNSISKIVTGTSFTMPASDADVELQITYSSHEYYVTASVPTPGKAGSDDSNVLITVNNSKQAVSMQAAAKGDTVAIKVEPNAGDKVKKVFITYTNPENNKEVRVNYNNPDFSFIMPDAAVTVTVLFNDEAFNVNAVNSDPSKGTFTVEASSVPVQSCIPGESLTVNTKAATGFSVGAMYYTKADGTEKQAISGGTFTMPGFDIKVYVEFTSTEKTVTLKSNSSWGKLSADANGIFGASVDSATTATFKASIGDKITITTAPIDGKALLSLDVYNTGDDTVKIDSTGYTFTMPAYDVTIDAVFTTATVATVKLSDEVEIPAGCNLFFRHNGAQLDAGANPGEFKATEGWTVEVYAPLDNTYGVSNVEVFTVGGNERVTVLNGNTFVMPKAAVYVVVTFNLT